MFGSKKFTGDLSDALFNRQQFEQAMFSYAKMVGKRGNMTPEEEAQERIINMKNFLESMLGAAGPGGEFSTIKGPGLSSTARDINIDIERLQVGEEVNFKDNTVQENRQMTLNELRDLLLEVVNSANQIAIG